MTNSQIEVLSDKNFLKSVMSQKQLIVVQFHNEINGSSQIMKRLFDRIQETFACRIICYRVLMPADEKILRQYKIHQTPAFLFIRENKTVEMIAGLISYDQLYAIVNKLIK